MSDIAIRVENLSKQYRIGAQQERYKTLRDTLTDAFVAPIRRVSKLLRGQASGAAELDETIWALKDISFEVRRGEVTGIIGRNGAGKTTLLKILSQITEPTEGRARIRGRVGSLLEVGTGFHPELTGRENIYLNGAILGMRRAEIDRKFAKVVAFAEVEKFIDTPVKHYSSGMQVRLAFSVAAHLEPEILLIDEVLAVGDIGFQKKCLGRMEDVVQEGRTVLLVSHNMGAILDLCQTAIHLHRGRLETEGEVNQVVHEYQASFQKSPEEASFRRGNVWFGDVIVGSQGSYVLEAGEPIRFVMTFGSFLDMTGFRMFCIVKNAKDETVIHSRVNSTELGGYGIDKGEEYVISVDTPPLWLNPGAYTVHFKVLVQGISGSKGRYLSDQVPFTVTGTANPMSSTVLNPPVEWSVRKGR
jgi:lipopolysaccharide transport system ATP-binding protein